MATAARDLLWDFALGNLAEGDRLEIEFELERSPELRAELAEIYDLSADVLSAIPLVAPAPHVKARLLESITASEPFTPWVEKLAAIADLTVERARQLMSDACDAKSWRPGGLDGLSIIPFSGGPRLEKAMACFVRLAPGLRFPHHLHQGEEISLVLQGGFKDSLGAITVLPGDVVVHPAGSEHHYVVDDDEECIGVVIVFGGVEFQATA